MAGIKHAKVSAKSDGADSSVVRPSDWNADHVDITRRKIKTSTDNTTSTSFVDAPEMTFSVESGKSYHFKFVVFFFTNATTVGIRFSINGPTVTSTRFGAIWATGAAANDVTIANAQTFTFDTSLVATSTGPGASGVMGIVEGTVTNFTASGTLALRYASETGAAVTIEAGSYGEITEV